MTRSLPALCLSLIAAALCACGGEPIETYPHSPAPADYRLVAASSPPSDPSLDPQARPIDGLAEAYRQGAPERERLRALQRGEPSSAPMAAAETDEPFDPAIAP